MSSITVYPKPNFVHLKQVLPLLNDENTRTALKCRLKSKQYLCVNIGCAAIALGLHFTRFNLSWRWHASIMGSGLLFSTIMFIWKRHEGNQIIQNLEKASVELENEWRKKTSWICHQYNNAPNNNKPDCIILRDNYDREYFKKRVEEFLNSPFLKTNLHQMSYTVFDRAFLKVYFSGFQLKWGNSLAKANEKGPVIILRNWNNGGLEAKPYIWKELGQS